MPYVLKWILHLKRKEKRKKVKEKLLKAIQNPVLQKIQIFFSILKHVLGFQNHTGTRQQKHDL